MPHPLDSVPHGIRLHGGAPDRGPIIITEEELDRLHAEAEAVRATEESAAGRRRLAPAVVLRAAREAAGLSPADAASKAGVPEETIRQVDSGRLADVTWTALDRYAAAVGLTLTLSAAPAAR
jgi:DNA-binding XRE family transcriptional regulator